MIISIILLLFASFFKAVADTLQHHFETSVFKKKDPRFWNPNESWKHTRFIPLTKYRADAWHLANSAMIVSFISFGVFYTPLKYEWWTEIAAAGILFNLLFGLFYSKLLRK